MSGLFKLTMCASVFSVCLATGGSAVQTTAAEPSHVGKQVEIRLSRCRIKLIKRVTLASDRPGILAFVEPEEGDAVRADQQIAGLRNEVATAQLKIREKEATNDVEIRYAKKAHDVAKAEHAQALVANRRVKKAVPPMEVLKLKLAAERSELQIEQAEMQFVINGLNLDEAQAQLKTYQIEAPFAGIVTRVYKSKGEAVRQGDPILELVNTDRVRVEGDVEIRQIWNVKRGARVTVWLDIPDEELDVEQQLFEGKIVFVDVTVQPVTRKVRVWAEISNRDNILRAGLPARMTIYPNQRIATKPASQNKSK